MSHSRTYLQNKLRENTEVVDFAPWHFHNKNSKRIWNTLQWLYKNNLLSPRGIETYNVGHKGRNNILKISYQDLNDEGLKVIEKCYHLIGNKYDRVETILSRCAKKL